MGRPTEQHPNARGLPRDDAVFNPARLAEAEMQLAHVMAIPRKTASDRADIKLAQIVIKQEKMLKTRGLKNG